MNKNQLQQLHIRDKDTPPPPLLSPPPPQPKLHHTAPPLPPQVHDTAPDLKWPISYYTVLVVLQL